MIKYKGRVKFLQYIKSKPVKFGIKAYLICNSFSGYCYGLIVYTGKKTLDIFPGLSKTESVVASLAAPYLNEWRILYCDNFFNTIRLSSYLLGHKTGLIGTLRKNRSCANTKIKFAKERGTTDIYVNPENTICMLYVKDKNEYIITTSVSYPTVIEVTNKFGQTRKSHDVMKSYCEGAKGVDLCNQQCTQFRYRHGSKKWWKPLCFHLLHLIMYNSFVLFRKFRKDLKFKQYYKQIILRLLGEPSIRAASRNYHPVAYIDGLRKSRRRLDCRECGKLTMWRCLKCSTKNKDVPLCLPYCFNQYHENRL